MHVDASRFEEIPENRHHIQAGCLLFPTEQPIVVGGGTSLDFVREQGGDDDTFIFMFGLRYAANLFGQQVAILEGVFLSESGPGFHATWDLDQLQQETDLGGWKVVPTQTVLEHWVQVVERRMNRG